MSTLPPPSASWARLIAPRRRRELALLAEYDGVQLSAASTETRNHAG